MEAEQLKTEILTDMGILTYVIAAPESILLLDDIMEVRLDFSGKENYLWQLEKYLDEKSPSSLYGVETSLNREDFETYLLLERVLNLENWAKARNIPCVLEIQGWGMKSICCRIIRHRLNRIRKLSSFNGDRPAT